MRTAAMCSALFMCSMTFLPLAQAQTTTTLTFDSRNFQTTFSASGSNWSGGIVRTAGFLRLYASGKFSYEVSSNGMVTFDEPIDSVRFFYVHDTATSHAAGTATAFDSANNELGSVNTNTATTFNASGNFETMDFVTSIDHIAFSSGIIDNFAFTTEGPVLIAVPDVVGLTEAAATADITDAELTVGTVTEEASDAVAVGLVIRQDPVATTMVDAGTAVDLVVSDGPEPVVVPDLAGLTQAEAEAAITTAGLVVGTVSTAPSDTVPAGDVISQSPAANTGVEVGSAVDFVVSTGAEPELCDALPDVLTQLTMFREAQEADDDFDGDGIPEDFILELVQLIGCMDAGSAVGIATLNAYDLNLMAFDAEDDAGDLADFRELIAILMALSADTQSFVRALIADPETLELTGEYAIVMCTDTDNCTPSAIKGTSLAEAYLTFEAGQKTVNEPYSATGNLDGDAFTNLVEFNNVIAIEGTAADFAIAASDPAVDGSEVSSGCGAGPIRGGAGRTSGGSLMLFGLVSVVLLTLRRRFAR